MLGDIKMRSSAPVFRATLLGLLCLGIAACDSLGIGEREASSSVTLGATPPSGRELGRVTYAAVDRLLAAAPAVGRDTPLAVATLTDVQVIDTSAPFGHLMSDLVRTRLAQQGMNVSELRLRTAMRMHPQQGELMLARTARDLVPPPAVSAFVTGTYAPAGELVFVSLRLVGATDGRILSAVDFAVPRYPDAQALLRAPAPQRAAAVR